jgi:hypothetical protein
VNRSEFISLAAAVGLFVIVLELVRRRRLQERYSLGWLASATILLVFAAIPPLTAFAANLLGIKTPVNFVFLVAFVATVGVLLHFSTVISRLVDRSIHLAQHVALLEERLARLEGADGGPVDDAGERTEVNMHF